MQPLYNTGPDLAQDKYIELKKQIDELQVSITEKDAEIIWLNMKLGDERSASRATLNRDLSKNTLHRDASRNSFMGLDHSKYESQIENLSKDKEKLEKRVKELELTKIKLEKEVEEVLHDRDNLKIQISYLQSSHKDQSKNAKLDTMLENKMLKQKMLEVKEDYGKLLNENLQYKERWEKEKKLMDDFRQSMDKHQEDVKKALKIHKANEKLAKQNYQLKNEIKVLKEQTMNATQSNLIRNSVSFQPNSSMQIEDDHGHSQNKG